MIRELRTEAKTLKVAMSGRGIGAGRIRWVRGCVAQKQSFEARLQVAALPASLAAELGPDQISTAMQDNPPAFLL